jgi:hypothetical protein
MVFPLIEQHSLILSLPVDESPSYTADLITITSNKRTDRMLTPIKKQVEVVEAKG